MKNKILLSILALMLFGFNAKSQTYCTPTYTGPGYAPAGGITTNFFTHILNISFGTINYTNPAPFGYASIPMYQNASALSTDVTVSFTYPISITLGNGANNQTLSVWIDFNSNKTFEASERVIFQSDPANTGSHVITANLTIPVNAVIGSTRMRVATKFNAGYPTNAALDPCVNNDPGGSGNNWSQHFIDVSLNIKAQAPQVYVSATTTQAVLDEVAKASTNNQIIGLQVVTNSDGTLNPLTLGDVNFGTIGTTNPSEITNAKLFYTGLSPAFTTNTQVGNTVAAPGTAFTINANQTLQPGRNYFWLTYDVTGTAIIGNTVDARCNYLTVANIQRIPTIVSPAGNRKVGYCVSRGAQPWFINFNNVRLNNLNNTTGWNTGYENYTGLLPDTILRGTTDTLFLTVGNGVNNASFRAWIDFNRDGQFTTTEQIYEDSILRNGGNAYVVAKGKPFTIPANAQLGTTRLRVSSQNANYPDPCTNPVQIGEVEDYNIVIKQDGQPVAEFKATTNCFGDPTDFTDNSYAFGNNIINSWSWNFGDPASGANNTSTLQNPQHLFSAGGVYNVTLTVNSNLPGTPNSVTRSVIVENPVAAFTMSSTSNGVPIQFSDASIGGTFVAWSWNFGDPASGVNNTSTNQNPIHTFASTGIYNVRLIVTTSAGCRDTVDVPVNIQLAMPIANYTSNEFNPFVTADVNLIDQSLYNPTSWEWSAVPSTITFKNSTTANSQNPVIAFNAPGTYQVKLKVCNTSGCDSITKTFIVKNYIAPRAKFIATPTLARTGQTVSFIDQSLNNPVSWLWYFGDSTAGVPNTSTQQYPNHIYTTADTFTVKLVVTNPAGTHDSTAVKYITVASSFDLCDNAAKSSASFNGFLFDSGGPLGTYGIGENCTFGIQPNCAGDITLTFTQFDITGGGDYLQVWDGINDTVGVPLHTGLGFTGATLPGPLVAKSGNVFVKMTTDGIGISAGFSMRWAASANVKPNASILGDTAGYLNAITRFTNASTGAGNSYRWDLNGDGIDDSTTLNASWKFITPGLKTIRLIASNCVGSDTAFFTINIKTPTAPPVIDFVADKTTISLNDDIILTDLSTNGPTSWKWDITPAIGYIYINGTSDTSYKPNVTFFFPGLYTVCLTATNVVGPAGPVCKTSYIYVKDLASMCILPNFSNQPTGDLYDSGGKGGNYSNLENCDYLIDACADKVTLRFKSFTFAAGDYLKIYDGKDTTGLPLFTGLGYTGNTLPPTLVGYSGYLYLVEQTSAAGVAAGFEAEWSIAAQDTPKPTFTAPDTAYVGDYHLFANTTTSNHNLWGWDFENDGNFDADTYNGIHMYTTAGLVDAALNATNCVYVGRQLKPILVLNPTQKPKADFRANIQSPSLRDTVVLDDLSAFGPTGWTWAITPASFTFVHGTTASSHSPHVVFNTPGAYQVCLTSSNTFGSDNLCRPAYINVRNYCTPGNSGTNALVGIYRVASGRVNNTSKMQSGYSDYSEVGTINLERGSNNTPITLERLPSNTAQNWVVWVDFNQDGDFLDAGEDVVTIPGTTLSSFTRNINVPVGAAFGATKLRVGVALGTGSNTSCGPNVQGEYEDYRVVITADVTKPIITVQGDNPDSTEVGFTYVDPGATAIDNVDGNITSKIVKTGTVNTAVLGTYTLTYNVADNAGNAADTKTRTVVVTADKTAPTVKLNGADTIYLEVFTAYTELGATSSDVKDGNLTAGIVVGGGVDITHLGYNYVTYTSTDLSGNTAVKTRVVKVRDTTRPVISLLGSAIVNIPQSTTPWPDPGTTVTDNYSNGLTSTVVGSVLNNVPGQYILLYNATDSVGNQAISVIRTVNVSAVGIEEMSGLNTLSIHPNPSAGLFTMQMKWNRSTEINLVVTDVTGKEVYRYSGNRMEYNLPIDLSSRANGMYFATLRANNEVITKKLFLNK